MIALSDFRNQLDLSKPFDYGWLLHLFVDACWDELEIPRFRTYHETLLPNKEWFLDYLEEIFRLSCCLYRTNVECHRAAERLRSGTEDCMNTNLPVDLNRIHHYSDRVLSRHETSNPKNEPSFYSAHDVDGFVEETIGRFIAWQ